MPADAAQGVLIAVLVPCFNESATIAGVVEDFRQVTAATVGQEHNDQRVWAGLGGHSQRRHGRHATGTAHQQTLLAGQSTRHVEGIGIGNGDDLIGDRRVVGRGPEVLADTLHQVGPAGAAGVHRTLGIGADDLDPSARHLLEVAPGAGDGSARADPGDEMRDLAVGIRPDLRAGGLIVTRRAVGVGILIGLPRAVDLND